MSQSVRIVLVSFLFSFPLLIGLVDAADSQAAHFSKSRSAIERFLDLSSDRKSLPPPVITWQPYWDNTLKEVAYTAELHPPADYFENALDAAALKVIATIDGRPAFHWHYDNPVEVKAGSPIVLQQSMTEYAPREDTVLVPEADDLKHTSVMVNDTENDLSISADRVVDLYSPRIKTLDGAVAFRFEVGALKEVDIKSVWVSLDLAHAMAQDRFIELQLMSDQKAPLSSVVLDVLPHHHTEMVRFKTTAGLTRSESIPMAVDALAKGSRTLDVSLSGFPSNVLTLDEDSRNGARLHIVYADEGDGEPDHGYNDAGMTDHSWLDDTRSSSPTGAQPPIKLSSVQLNTTRMAKTSGAIDSFNSTLVTATSISPHGTGANPNPPNVTASYGEIRGWSNGCNS